MNRHDIRTAEDIARIEAGPYAGFMPHAHVFTALADAAATHGPRHALTFLPDSDLEHPARHWTYAAFLAEVTQAAHLFHRLAAPEAPRVALLLPAIPQAHFALWGAEAAGVACPLNYLLNTEHLAALIESAGCNILVALGPNNALDIASRLPALRRACPGLLHVLQVNEEGGASPGDFDTLRHAEPSDVLRFDLPRAPSRVAALFHTGGTTGLPKLARHTHGNQLHSAWGAAQMYGTTEHDRIVNGFPLFHVAGSLVFGLSTLLAGGTVVLPTLLGLRDTGFMKRYWGFVRRERVTLVTATPTGIATLMNAPANDGDTRTVRALLTGGAPLPGELAQAFEDRMGIPVRNTLGMTESAGVVSIEPVRMPRVPGSCGLRLPYTVVQAGTTDAVDVPGILRLRGPNVSPGYTDAQRDAGTFEDGWLISGDIAHLDAAQRVHVTGRAKDVIIRNSHNIDPGLIEDALLRHPGVQFAAAVGQPDEYAGELPVAYVVARPGAVLDEAALLHFLEPHIAERPAFPKRLLLVDALPQTAVGKVYKPALRLMAIERVIGERLAAANLAARVSVQGEEGPHGLALAFTPTDPADASLADALKPLMQPFAIRYRIAR